jgi:hypothetical protein
MLRLTRWSSHAGVLTLGFVIFKLGIKYTLKSYQAFFMSI